MTAPTEKEYITIQTKALELSAKLIGLCNEFQRELREEHSATVVSNAMAEGVCLLHNSMLQTYADSMDQALEVACELHKRQIGMLMSSVELRDTVASVTEAVQEIIEQAKEAKH